jgi:RNA polymerase sigma-54 factor
LDVDEELQQLAERIISTLVAEDGGRFTANLNDLFPAGSDAKQLERAQEALELVQSLDPPGIAASDLRECLLLQINPAIPYYEEMKTLISNHLEDLRDNRLPQIQRATAYTIETIQAAWEQLRTLDPLPASEFAEKYNPTVKPDVFLEQAEDGRYVVRLEDSGIPSLYISPYYVRRLQSGQATAEEKEFIRKKVNSAQWLIDSIEQRRSTLTKVSQAIVDHQTRFLDDGPEFIEPLKMQQIADKVGVHVTTVSRAVDDKWIQTPRGILPLRRFFVGGTTSDDGEDIAWDTIRIKLQELIDHEDKSKPYSDDELVKRLKAQGLNVARRTITKYRQKMNIPSSRQRRDWSKSK